jgi:mono/diheme cytochrome c family protein
MKTCRIRRYAQLIVAAAGITGIGWSLAPASPAAADEPPWEAPARAARKKNPVPADDTAIAAGKAVYARECLQCHGAQGKGDGPASKDLTMKPHNLGDDAVVKQTDGALFWKLTEGRKPMPSYDKTLSETERWQVIDYVRTLANAKK